MTLTRKTCLLLAILTAIFASLISAQPAAASNAATFVRTDTKTQGSWQGAYGADGYAVPEPLASKSPSYVAVTPQGQSNWTWASSTTDVRALQSPASSTRQASCWYTGGNSSFDLDVNINDGNTHQIALYALDWDSRGRSETIQALDGDTGTVLNSQSVSSFVNGTYLVWDISGHVKFNIVWNGGDNAVISAIFFDVATATNSTAGIAHYLSTDTSTEGNWLGAYGADGYSLEGASQSLPSYAAVSPQHDVTWTWAASTSDTRALELATNTGRIAATWYNAPSFSIDVNITDGGTHQIALYSIDWDMKGRAQTVQVVDAASGAVLDSRSEYSFTNGVYLVWTVSGHVKFNITASSGPNAVVSGIFFGGAGTVPTPPPTSSGSSSSSGSTGSSSGGSSSSSNANCPPVINAVSFLGIDTTTQGAWKGLGNFNAPPASSSLVYGKDGDILPDTEGCDTACNPFPSYVAFGPACVSATTSGNTGSKANSTHAYVNMVQGSANVMGAEPGNTTNTNFFQCNYTNSNPAIPWAPMVAWRPVVDTREISNWYTCSGITSFYLELNFGSSAHNFEIYVVDDQNGSSNLRSEEIQVLDGDTGAVLYDSGSFTNFTGGVYYKWSISGHVKVKVINTSTTGTNAVINGAFFN